MLSLAPYLARRIAGGTLVVDANADRPDLTTRLDMSAIRRGGASARTVEETQFGAEWMARLSNDRRTIERIARSVRGSGSADWIFR